MKRVEKITLAGKGGYPVNIYLIDAGRSLILIDTGYDTTAAEVENNIGARRLEKILLTHYHPDHSEAAGILAVRTGARVHAHQLEAEMLESRQEGFKIIPVEDGENVGCQEVELQAISTPGHTRGHLAFFLPEEGILFSGDLVVGDSTTWVGPPDGDIGDYLNSLFRLQKMKISRIFPGHGPEIRQPEERIIALIRHRRMREEQILRQLEKGKQSLETLITEIYPVLDQKFWLVARLTIEGHLLKLKREGRISIAPGEEDCYQLLNDSD